MVRHVGTAISQLNDFPCWSASNSQVSEGFPFLSRAATAANRLYLRTGRLSTHHAKRGESVVFFLRDFVGFINMKHKLLSSLIYALLLKLIG